MKWSRFCRFVDFVGLFGGLFLPFGRVAFGASSFRGGFQSVGIYALSASSYGASGVFSVELLSGR